MATQDEKTELLRGLEEQGAELPAALQGLDDAALTAPGVTGEAWSIRETVAHLAGWEREVATAIAAVRDGRQPRFDFDLRVTESWQRLNDRQAAEAARRPAPAVLREWVEGRQSLIALVKAMPPDLLDRTIEPWRGTVASTVRDALTAEVLGHAAEHLGGIRAWLERRAG